MRETVSDYETTEVEREIVRSDLSGTELDEDEVIELVVNPNLNHRSSAGELHLSTEEFAELKDMDDVDVDPDHHYPEWYVREAQPEVVERNLLRIPDINLGPDGIDRFEFHLSGLAAFTGVVSAMYVLFQYPNQVSTLGELAVVAAACMSFVLSLLWAVLYTLVVISNAE